MLLNTTSFILYTVTYMVTVVMLVKFIKSTLFPFLTSDTALPYTMTGFYFLVVLLTIIMTIFGIQLFADIVCDTQEKEVVVKWFMCVLILIMILFGTAVIAQSIQLITVTGFDVHTISAYTYDPFSKIEQMSADIYSFLSKSGCALFTFTTIAAIFLGSMFGGIIGFIYGWSKGIDYVMIP